MKILLRFIQDKEFHELISYNAKTRDGYVLHRKLDRQWFIIEHVVEVKLSTEDNITSES